MKGREKVGSQDLILTRAENDIGFGHKEKLSLGVLWVKLRFNT